MSTGLTRSAREILCTEMMMQRLINAASFGS
jgi:hypothetical protein